MPRKTTENGGSSRNKSRSSVRPAAISVVPETRKNVVPISLDDEIRRRAYEIYLERGGVAGNQQDDWMAAEREIRGRYRQQGQTA